MKTVHKKSKRKKDMDDKERIDLTDLNKKKKSLKLPAASVFKKQKGPLRDEEGKFATTSGGGLKSMKKLNWKRAAPLIAVVALVGGFLVFQSFAATPQMVPKTTTKTITETIPDKSKSYKTLKASNVNKPPHSTGSAQYTTTVNTWSPTEPVIEVTRSRAGAIRTKIGWVGPENITICATVLGPVNSPVNIEVKNWTTVSSSGPGITTKAATIGERDGVRVAPTGFRGQPVPQQNQSMHMRRVEVCTDALTRGNYGSDLEIMIFAQMFEKLEVYGLYTETKGESDAGNAPATQQNTTGSGSQNRQSQPTGRLDRLWRLFRR